MPKVKWAADADEALSAKDIDEAEDSQFTPYMGDIPPNGPYRFRVAQMKSWKSSNDNPGIKLLLILDGSWKADHRQYDGCPLWDQVMMIKNSAAFVAAFCAALQVKSSDLVNNTVVDGDGNVTAIGSKKITQDTVVYVNCQRGKSNTGADRLEVRGTGYLAPPETVEADEDTDAAPKKKKEKAGKGKGKKGDDDPPF